MEFLPLDMSIEAWVNIRTQNSADKKGERSSKYQALGLVTLFLGFGPYAETSC